MGHKTLLAFQMQDKATSLKHASIEVTPIYLRNSEGLEPENLLKWRAGSLTALFQLKGLWDHGLQSMHYLRLENLEFFAYVQSVHNYDLSVATDVR